MSNFLSFIGWTFLPDLVTSNLQAFYYNLTRPAGAAKPQPGTPIFIKHRRRIYIGVIVCYLLYTLFEADWDIRREGDFYHDLGVPYNAEDRQIQSRFRKLTLLHHPDKLPSSTPPSIAAAAQSYYIHLTTARDVLTNSARRYAYDRFGPGTAVQGSSWSHLKTIKEFTLAGLQQLLPLYISSALGLWIATWFGFLDTGGVVWRYLALAAMACAEWHAITRPWHTPLALVPTVINPWIRAAAASLPEPALALFGLGGGRATILSLIRQAYLPFQAIQVAHRALLTFFIALSRLGPFLVNDAAGMTGLEGLNRQVTQLEQIVKINAGEAARLLALEAVPFKQGVEHDGVGALHGITWIGSQMGSTVKDPGFERLRGKLKEWFVTNTIRQDPEVQAAVARVVERQKEQALQQ